MNRLFREKETDDIHRYNAMLYIYIYMGTQDVGPAG